MVGMLGFLARFLTRISARFLTKVFGFAGSSGTKKYSFAGSMRRKNTFWHRYLLYFTALPFFPVFPTSLLFLTDLPLYCTVLPLYFTIVLTSLAYFTTTPLKKRWLLISFGQVFEGFWTEKWTFKKLKKIVKNHSKIIAKTWQNVAKRGLFSLYVYYCEAS